MSSKEFEGRSIKYHKRNIKINHTDTWIFAKIISLQDKKEEIYFELYFIYSYLLIITLLFMTCPWSMRLEIFGTRRPSFLCYIQVFNSYFYHSTLLVDLKSDIPPLMNFHLVISPLCFQIFHQPQTRTVSTNDNTKWWA